MSCQANLVIYGFKEQSIMYLSSSVKLSILEGSFATIHLPEKSPFMVLRFCRSPVYQCSEAVEKRQSVFSDSLYTCSLYTGALSLLSLEVMEIREELGF